MKTEDYTEKTLQSQYIYKGKIVNLRKDYVELPGGKKSTREIVEHQGAVAVVPITKNNEIIFVKQYRKPVEEVLLEIPAGKLEKGEEPRECAMRELEEETGKKASELHELFHFYTSPGFSNEKLYLFAATNLEDTIQNLDTDEILTVHSLSIDKAISMVKNGEIKDAKTITGIFAIKDFLDERK
ncbi:MAG: ADP-ribose pyrophosphatase [Clostridia bacterium]|jgi:ADP-ribose pyrophosphatase|nr:ADP-ribose pyrophosphatase [Clostridia bacterium]